MCTSLCDAQLILGFTNISGIFSIDKTLSEYLVMLIDVNNILSLFSFSHFKMRNVKKQDYIIVMCHSIQHIVSA